MPVLGYLEHTPSVGAGVRLADDAVVVGKVSIGGPAAIESSAVLRGDQSWIAIEPVFRMGRRATIHTEQDRPTRVAGGVWLGDESVVHACSLGEGVRVEDGGLVLTGSTVGAGSVVAADSLVPEGATFEPNSYISGTPGRRVRETTPEERQATAEWVQAALPPSPSGRGRG
jgi:carbonic anhydrase/acetyltransferase-like protein (isoleucine patch superfamily)